MNRLPLSFCLRWRNVWCRLAILTAVLSFVGGCAASSSTTGGEPAAKEDATPPVDYNPHYINSIAQLPSEPAQVRVHPILEINRIDSRDPNRVKIYASLSDTDGHYLTGAALAKYKSHWCLVSDQLLDQTPVTIQKYKLKEVTEVQRVPTALAIVMDHSGSMGEDRAHVIEDAAAELVDTKRPEDAFALIKYDDKVVVEVPLSSNASVLKSTLVHGGLTGFGGTTAILDGIAAGLNEVERAPAPYDNRAVALFTDGIDNSSTANKDSLLRAARHSNVTVCMIGFGENVNEPFLKYLSSTTGGLYRHAYKTGEIKSLFEDLYKRLRNSYVFEYTPPSYGLHNVKLTLCLPHDTLIADGIYDNTPNIGDISKMEVYFDLNSSKLLPTSTEAIDNAVQLLKAYPSLTIEVRGHTDSTNKTKDPEFNKKLSQKRADIVKAALVKRGIAERRITSVGFGDSQPIADNATEDGRALNRRTEFVIEGK